MDLDRCPKCGNAWQGGDKCRSCGFVPIGAGLDKLPKKKKKRVRKYVEPGSWRSFMGTAFVGGAAYFCIAYQPWQDDWEFVRALFGQGRHHSVVGEWEIVKTLSIDKKKAVLANGRVSKGTLKFTDKGLVKMNLVSGPTKTDASGSYQVLGSLVALNRLSSASPGGVVLPASLKLNLAWTGPDSMVASCNGAEALYLRRHDDKNPLRKLLRVGIKPGSGEEPPAGVKNLADKMTAGVKNAQGD